MRRRYDGRRQKARPDRADPGQVALREASPTTEGSVSACNSARDTHPASNAPTIGATQNSHNCCSAQPPTKSAGPVLRAGFTEVLVTGMLTRWMSVSANPMAMPANPTGARLWIAPMITTRKPKVIVTSVTRLEASEYFPGE